MRSQSIDGVRRYDGVESEGKTVTLADTSPGAASSGKQGLQPQSEQAKKEKKEKKIDESGIRTHVLSDQCFANALNWRLRPLGHLTDE